MNRYDDYNPHIFYGDENADQEMTLGPEVDKKQTNRKIREGKNLSNTRKKAGVSRNKKTDSEKVTYFKKTKDALSSRTSMAVIGIILAGLAAYFIISFVSYIGSCLSDQSIIANHEFGTIPEVSNSGGEGGARLSELFINQGFGLGAFVIIIWLICMSLKFLIGKPRFRTLDFTIKCLIAFVTLSLIVGLVTIGTNSLINWGGYHGRYVNEWIIGFLGWGGAVILCLVMIALFVVICLRDIIKWILAKKRILDEKRRLIMEKRAEERAKARELAEHRKNERELDYNAESGSPEDENPDETNITEGVSFGNVAVYPETEEEVESFTYSSDSDQYDSVIRSRQEENLEYKLPEETEIIEETETPGKEEEQQSDTADANEDPMVVNVNQIGKADSLHSESIRKSMYNFPPLNLLKDRGERITVDASEQLANKEKIKQTLQEYGVPIVSIEAHVGPTVTLYEIRPDKGKRISTIKGLVDEIAMSLSAIGVRVIAPLPGRGTVGIEVANMNPQTVSLRSILQSKKFQESKAQLPLALGSTISNDVYIADLAAIPHLLVAGATGKGKSVGLNVIIMSLLYKRRPDELKFVMFDPKMVEFNLYAAIEKQYLAKLPDEEEAIVTDMSKVVPTLNSLCIEMDDRYKLLKEAEVRKIDEYNKLIKSGKFKDRPNHKYLPYIVVVVDEFADLIMTAGKEAEMPIARLAQKARAVGIHVIIATQRPSTTVITGNIKNNFTGRIAFQVSSGTDSKVILDTTGAQQLIGKGDMLILNNSELTRVQCAFVDTPEVKEICEYISTQPFPQGSPYLLPEPMTAELSGETAGGLSAAEKDPLYDEIRTYVITSGVASTSNIQRKYQLGYNRAGRIMDQLEAEGVVGPSQGGKARAVLVSS